MRRAGDGWRFLMVMGVLGLAGLAPARADEAASATSSGPTPATNAPATTPPPVAPSAAPAPAPALPEASPAVAPAAPDAAPAAPSAAQAPVPAIAPTPAAPNATAATAPAAASATAIADHMVVRMEYQLRTDDGALVDSTEGRAPFEYTHGLGQIIPGLERQLAGLRAGDQKTVTVAPEEGYGPLNPLATEEVDRAQLPKETEPQAGMVLRGTDPDGRVFRALIKEVKEKSVVLDLNHPLAGKTLTFQVKIVDVQPAPAAP